MAEAEAGGVAVLEQPERLTPTTLTELQAAIPPELFRPSLSKACGAVLTTLGLSALAVVLAIWSWQQGSWVWMPVSWWLSGFALTSLFVVAHDCAHLSFLPGRQANFWLGHTLMLPTLYPFHAWRFSHNAHHGRTNCFDEETDLLYCDNAWLPHSTHWFRQTWANQRVMGWIYLLCRVCIPIGSSVHAMVMHYWPWWYRPLHRRSVVFSIVLQLAFCCLAVWGIVALSGSWWGLLHFALVPWLGFQCWMAVYTFLHHTADDIPLFSKETWTAVNGQLHGTLNCRFPRWISFFHHAIDVHIPHHIAVNIPSYHLVAASNALQQSSFQPYVREIPFSWRYLMRQIYRCVWYDPEQRLYQPMNQFSQLTTPPAVR